MNTLLKAGLLHVMIFSFFFPPPSPKFLCLTPFLILQVALGWTVLTLFYIVGSIANYIQDRVAASFFNWKNLHNRFSTPGLNASIINYSYSRSYGMISSIVEFPCQASTCLASLMRLERTKDSTAPVFSNTLECET